MTFRPIGAVIAGSSLAFCIGIAWLGCQGGGIGDPCLPELESDPFFAGFDVGEEFVESRSFQCETRICLINHFRGRVSCPAGQAEPTPCRPGGDECEGEGGPMPAAKALWCPIR